MIIDYLKKLTFLSKEEIEEIKKEISAFREDVKEQYTSEQMEEMQKRYENKCDFSIIPTPSGMF